MKKELDAKYANNLIAAERERHVAVAAAMEKCFAEGVAIYGAGFLGTWANSYLQSLGIKVTKFFDRDNRKIGGEIDGIPLPARRRTNWHPYRLSSSLLGMLFAKCNRSWRLTVWQPCLSTAILWHAISVA